jgi:hypothetical protein
LKHFIDEEGIIEGVVDGTGDAKGLAIFKIRDCRGNLLTVCPRGNREERRNWFQNPQQVIGRRYTFRYFELSADNIPRFATGKAFRDN